MRVYQRPSDRAAARRQRSWGHCLTALEPYMVAGFRARRELLKEMGSSPESAARSNSCGYNFDCLELPAYEHRYQCYASSRTGRTQERRRLVCNEHALEVARRFEIDLPEHRS